MGLQKSCKSGVRSRAALLLEALKRKKKTQFQLVVGITLLPFFFFFEVCCVAVSCMAIGSLSTKKRQMSLCASIGIVSLLTTLGEEEKKKT